MRRRLKLDAMRSAITTSARTKSAVSVLAQNTIGRTMRQMHSGIWQSRTRSRRLNQHAFGDQLHRASALTGRTELSFEKFLNQFDAFLRDTTVENMVAANDLWGLLRFAHIAHFLFYNSRIVIL